MVKGDGTIEVWKSLQRKQSLEVPSSVVEAEPPPERTTSDSRRGQRGTDRVSAVAFVPGSRGNKVWVAYRNGLVFEWNIEENTINDIRGEGGDPWVAISFNAEGTAYLALTGERWDRTESPRKVLYGETNNPGVAQLVDSFDESPGYLAHTGYLVLVNKNNDIHLLSVENPDQTQVKTTSDSRELRLLGIAHEHLFAIQNNKLHYWALLDFAKPDKNNPDGTLLSAPAALNGVINVIEADSEKGGEVRTINANGEIAHFALTAPVLLDLLARSAGASREGDVVCAPFETHDDLMFAIRQLGRDKPLLDKHWEELEAQCASPQQ
jgi:WD40 repeat protein